MLMNPTLQSSPPRVAPRAAGSPGRKAFIEVEPNVQLHVTDLGEGTPVVLIHGWPLSDAMCEYQYAELVGKGYRVIGITLRGFGQSSKPYGAYNYDVFADDIKAVLDKLDIRNATLGGFSMGGHRHSLRSPAQRRPRKQAGFVWGGCAGMDPKS